MNISGTENQISQTEPIGSAIESPISNEDSTSKYIDEENSKSLINNDNTVKSNEEEEKEDQIIHIKTENLNEEEELKDKENVLSYEKSPSANNDCQTEYISNKANEEEEYFNNINITEEEESKEFIKSNYSEGKLNTLSNNGFNEEEDKAQEISNNFLIEEEDNSSNLDVRFDSDIDYSYDSEHELINDIFDENRPRLIVRRNYQDEFDKRSIKSMRSMRSTRSSKTMKKRYMSKIQKYNVTRPFVKTEHFDTEKKLNENEYIEKAEPIRYAGSKGFLKRQAKSNKNRLELRSQEPTERGFDPPFYIDEESPKNSNAYKNTSTQKDKNTQIQYIYKSAGKSSPIQANAYLNDLFESSVKKPPAFVEEPLPKMYKVNQTSEDIAKQKNQELIEVITGKEKTIPEIKFVSIMRRFNISNTPEPENPYVPRPLICKIKDTVKLDKDKYDNVKLKELLIDAFVGENMNELLNELRPPVLAALSNIRPSYIIPRKSPQNSRSPKNVNNKSVIKTPNKNNKSQNVSPKPSNKSNGSGQQNVLADSGDYSTDEEIIETNIQKQKSKSKTPQKKTNPMQAAKSSEDPKAKTVNIQKGKKKQIQNSPEKEDNSKNQGSHKKKKRSNQDNQFEPDMNNSIESIELPEKEQEKPKKKVSPRPQTSKGAKYFPGFYDNLDFFVNNNRPPARH